MEIAKLKIIVSIETTGAVLNGFSRSEGIGETVEIDLDRLSPTARALAAACAKVGITRLATRPAIFGVVPGRTRNRFGAPEPTRDRRVPILMPCAGERYERDRDAYGYFERAARDLFERHGGYGGSLARLDPATIQPAQETSQGSGLFYALR